MDNSNIAIFWIISGIIGFLINCGICYIISKLIGKYYNKKKNNNKNHKKSRIMEFLFGLLILIYLLGLIVAGCYVFGVGIIVFRAFSDNGITGGIISIIIDLIACLYLSISPVNYRQ